MNKLKPLIDKLGLTRADNQRISNIKNESEVLESLRELVPEEKLINRIEEYYAVKHIDLKSMEVSDVILKNFKMESMKAIMVAPYSFNSLTNTYEFALSNFEDAEIRNQITLLCRRERKNASFRFAFESDIQTFFEKVGGAAVAPVNAPISKSEPMPQAVAGDFNAPDFLDGVLNKALDFNASDIHIERLEKALQVRYRVDGVMGKKEIFRFGDGEISSIFVRLKGMSNMDIAEKRKPQDGRIDNYEYKGMFYDLRVSTVATILGEKAVLRIFNKTSRILTFEELGFGETETENVKAMLHSQNGIILMAGATGSGKTTSLYTMIDEVNSDEVNIYTLEDPVEKTLENVNQIQIDPKAGVDYPSTLKALLRQDPDIIVVGEIRDSETAELSIRASLTGHLVLSTVHANGALDAISRLLDMGIEAYLLGASSQGFLSQRLVRRICPKCRKKMTSFKPYEKEWLRKLSEENEIEMPQPGQMYEAVGCDSCVKGYKGRIAVIEAIRVTEKLRALLSNGASMNTIKQAVKEEGFVPMQLSAYEKALEGITSLDEVIRKLS